jgi:SAM-dependent methyltransferase
MAACCSRYERAADRQFDERTAAADLDRFRRRGPGPTTRLLLEQLQEAGLADGDLLDIGGGVGALTFGLVERGVAHAVGVDASRAYVAAFAREIDARGLGARIRVLHADFVESASDLESASLVTLDRVVCCYPSADALLRTAAAHATRGVALSYPRDRWYVRMGIALENAGRRLTGNEFRSFAHRAPHLREIFDECGLHLRSRRETFVWSADVYVRSAHV